MVLKRLVTSSVRSQLLAGFLAVIVAFGIALVIAISGISSVSSTVRKGYGAAAQAQEASASARNMAGSALLNALTGGKEQANHESDVAGFRTVLAQLSKDATSSSDKTARSGIETQFAAWTVIDKQSDQLAHKGLTPALVTLATGKANEAADTLSKALETYAVQRQREANSASSSATT